MGKRQEKEARHFNMPVEWGAPIQEYLARTGETFNGLICRLLRQEVGEDVLCELIDNRMIRNEEQYAKTVELFDTGEYSISAISREVGITRETVRRYLVDAGRLETIEK